MCSFLIETRCQWSDCGGVSRDCLALWISQPLLGRGNPINLRNYTRLHRDLIINHGLYKNIWVPRQFERWPVRKSKTNMPCRGLYERTTHLFSAIDLEHNCRPFGVNIGLWNPFFIDAMCWWMQCNSKGHQQLIHHQHFPVVHMEPWAYACRWRLVRVPDQLIQLPSFFSNYNILIGLWYIYAHKVPLLS